MRGTFIERDVIVYVTSQHRRYAEFTRDYRRSAVSNVECHVLLPQASWANCPRIVATVPRVKNKTFDPTCARTMYQADCRLSRKVHHQPERFRLIEHLSYGRVLQINRNSGSVSVRSNPYAFDQTL